VLPIRTDGSVEQAVEAVLHALRPGESR
jgi:hypothetical protein